jgi:hypothetical protein
MARRKRGEDGTRHEQARTRWRVAKQFEFKTTGAMSHSPKTKESWLQVHPIESAPASACAQAVMLHALLVNSSLADMVQCRLAAIHCPPATTVAVNPDLIP